MVDVLGDAELDNVFVQRFQDHIAAEDFPCVGAKSALARQSLTALVCHDVQSAWDDVRIHRKLLDWSNEYREDASGLRSLVVIFRQPAPLGEAEYEEAMWDRLQSLADKDEWLGQDYAAAVKADPGDPHFALSFGGQAYFVVGMHPHASRPARRFSHAAMVFNLHDQFVKLREQGRYERMRDVILSRDVTLAGSMNPMVARHGEVSEAAQYSGRQVDSDWKCPFRDKRAAS